MSDQLLKKPQALVTGANSGIGQAIAILYIDGVMTLHPGFATGG